MIAQSCIPYIHLPYLMAYKTHMEYKMLPQFQLGKSRKKNQNTNIKCD